MLKDGTLVILQLLLQMTKTVKYYSEAPIYSVSGGIVNILGGGSMEYSE
jgi:hypothetical protein